MSNAKSVLLEVQPISHQKLTMERVGKKGRRWFLDGMELPHILVDGVTIDLSKPAARATITLEVDISGIDPYELDKVPRK